MAKRVRYYRLEQRQVEMTRLSQVDLADAVNPWGAHDVSWRVNAVCLWDAFPGAQRGYVALSSEGDVELMGPGGRPQIVEHIDGAGLNRDWSRFLGYLNQVRQIGTSLYACGGANQVYRRGLQTGWELISASILIDPEARQKRDDPMLGIRHLADVFGLTEDDIYVSGEFGEIHHFDGTQWRAIETDTTKPLFRICAAASDDIFVAGGYGSLLRGNKDIGFRSVWPLIDDAYFTGLAYYNGMIFLGSTQRGLYVFDPATGKAEPYATGLEPEFQDPHRLEAKDGVLWCFGFKDLACFDGAAWVRVHHPDNPRIGT